MKLIDLDPCFVGAGGDGISRINPVTKEREPVPKREGIGISFDCPCGCGSPVFVHIKNPMDGKPFDTQGAPSWDRTGDDFETMTLKPSILRSENRGGCGWHGFVTDGKIITV